jgi:hypothetical protein
VLANQLSVKLYVSGPARTAADLEPLIAIFHGWIRDKNHRLCGKLMIDVADYRHVKDGPGVVLIGHEAHWGMGWLGGDGAGLTYGRKRDTPDEVKGKLAEAFHDALTAATMLEAEATSGLSFDGARARIMFMNRLYAENDAAGFAAARGDLEDFAKKLWGSATLTHVSADPRTPLTVDVSGASMSARDLLARLR